MKTRNDGGDDGDDDDDGDAIARKFEVTRSLCVILDGSCRKMAFVDPRKATEPFR